MDYQNYMVIDFTMDDDFFQWVWQPDERSDKFWTAWLKQHPHKREEVQEARELILSVKEFMKIMNLGEAPPAVFKAEIKKHCKELMAGFNPTMDDLPGQISQNHEMRGKSTNK